MTLLSQWPCTRIANGTPSVSRNSSFVVKAVGVEDVNDTTTGTDGRSEVRPRPAGKVTVSGTRVSSGSCGASSKLA